MRIIVQENLPTFAGGFLPSGYTYKLLEDAIFKKLDNDHKSPFSGVGNAGGGSSGGGGAGGW